MFGGRPFVLILSREIDEPLTGLVKKLDEATIRHRDAKLGGVWIICGEDEERFEKELRDLAGKIELKHILLATHPSANGHKNYPHATEAHVTVIAFDNWIVKLNWAFRKGEWNDQAVAKVLAGIPELVKKK